MSQVMSSTLVVQKSESTQIRNLNLYREVVQICFAQMVDK